MSIDPCPLRAALDHIAKTAEASRTSTRRLRWIQKRAELALAGVPYDIRALELPKDNPDATEKLKRKLGHAKRLLAAHGIEWEEDPREVAQQQSGAA